MYADDFDSKEKERVHHKEEAGSSSDHKVEKGKMEFWGEGLKASQEFAEYRNDGKIKIDRFLGCLKGAKKLETYNFCIFRATFNVGI